jgi:hypothetical protein
VIRWLISEEKKMTIREKFTQEEWEHVVQSPMLAGLAITAADPGGLWSTIKESASVAKSILESGSEAGEDSLPEVISATFQQSDGRRIAQDQVKGMLKGKRPAEVTDLAVTRLSEIRQLVESKAPEQADAYKAFVRATAKQVAEAGKEGGFMGFGGEAVSEAEKKTLSDIDRALG